MSGAPYTYSRAMAIAQLMKDHRRPAIKKAEAEKHLRRVYLFGNDLFVTYQDTIDWVPKLSRLTRFGREEHFVNPSKEIEGQPYVQQWSDMVIEPIDGWPSEEEIKKCIEESAEREKLGGSLSTNDIVAFERMQGRAEKEAT